MVLSSLQTLIRICNLRKYVGRIYYIPAPGYEGTGTPLSRELGGTILLKSHGGDGDRSSHQNSYAGPLYELTKSSQWREMEGPFINVWLNNVPFVGETVNSAPHAKVITQIILLFFIESCYGLFTSVERAWLILFPD